MRRGRRREEKGGEKGGEGGEGIKCNGGIVPDVQQNVTLGHVKMSSQGFCWPNSDPATKTGH